MIKLPANQWGIDWAKAAKATGVAEVPLIQRHSFCAYHNVGLGMFYHFREFLKALWPKFQWHRWADRMVEGFCLSDWLVWAGPGGSGKSTVAAMCVIGYWLLAPHETAVIVCSTTMKMLRMRIWNEIMNFFMELPVGIIFPEGCGIPQNTETKILWRRGDDKHGITGVAVEEGDVKTIVHNHLGVHTKRVVLVLDEAQGVRPAILSAAEANMSKNPSFKALLLGNPEDQNDLHGKEAEPVGGWDSIDPEVDETWTTRGINVRTKGRCDFFHGRRSPANDSPEELLRLRFLTNNQQIDDHLYRLKGNANDPSFWSQSLGFWPPMGLDSTILDQAIITTFKCREAAVWTGGFTMSAALDAAYGGGDNAILTFLKRGEVVNELGKKRWVIEVGEQLMVPIDGNSNRPIHYQILDFCRAHCEKRKVPPREFALDSGGEGGGLKAIFDKEWGEVNGVEPGGAPSDVVVESVGKSAKDAYDTRASELCFNVRNFAMANGLRGLPDKVLNQAVARRSFYRNGKWCAEPKTGSKGRTDEKGRPVKGYKQRLGHSPDEFDSVAVGVCHCIERGAYPSMEGAAENEIEAEQPESVDEFSESNYLLDIV